MGTRLSHAVREVYETKPEETFFWTDSMVCLHWIHMPAKAFKAYVAHRVGEVQNFTEPRQWKHVPTLENPADIGTRKITASDLMSKELWWKGPDFLRKPATEWPTRQIIKIPDGEDKEMKSTLIGRADGKPADHAFVSGHSTKRVSFSSTVTLLRPNETTRILKTDVATLSQEDFDKEMESSRTSFRRQQRELLHLRKDFRPMRISWCGTKEATVAKGEEAIATTAKEEKRESENQSTQGVGKSDVWKTQETTNSGPQEQSIDRQALPNDPSKPRKKRGKKLYGMAIIDPGHHSVGLLWNGLRRMIRITALVIRFIRNTLRAVRKLPSVSTGFGKTLLPGEISIAKKRQIRLAQEKSFKEEIELLKDTKNRPALGLPRKSRLRKFTPFLDDQKVLRCQSRIEKADVYGYNTIYPIILDRQSDLARLIAEDKHFELAHPIGINAVKAAIQSEYIILGLGTLLWSIKWRCTRCQRNFGKPAEQIEAPLPSRRTGNELLKPFADVGIDYAGPFSIIMGRGQRRKKVYVLVMTCLATRAVHLEATGGMETQHVINAISRFTDIRGVPVSITSDNQTSFVKADADLVSWIQSLNFEEIAKKTSDYRNRGIRWIFNPPIAPHFGGVYEIIVKATKRALSATVGTADLNEEEFRTAISKVTWMLNNRPIQKVGDSNDWQTLTPNHFLNCPEDATFPPDLPTGKNQLQERLRYQIEVQSHFWQRFQREIVPLLAPRSKWFQRSENLSVGDLVIEIDDTTNRGLWKMARIIEIFPSKDDFVRTVKIVDSKGRTFLRPICRFIPLHV